MLDNLRKLGMQQKIISAFINFTLLIISFGCRSKKVEYPAPTKEGKDGSIILTSSTFKFRDEEFLADYEIITVAENRKDTTLRLIHFPVICIHAYTNFVKYL